ncbi:hypothetical protein [Treponema sp.]|uniref:hypothetical protein n=1 Tax=Treponema sp. TaxID=166 RepID=UPI0025D79BDA|nr:hypothetical protein [Treponema sp.]MCR5219140.1 hypothetical protein [Treponema sp.]
MKNVKKIFGLFASLMLLTGTFTACSDSDSGSSAAEVDYIEEGGSATVNVGETITLYAEGKTSVDDFTCDGLTIEYKGNDAFEVTASEDATDATVVLNFYDGTDTDDGINFTLYVYDPYFTLNLTLDSTVASEAASITVYAEGKEDSESSAALYQTVTATYTAGETSATAELAKEKANSYDFFNNIVVTVKDSDGNEIDVETSPVYFCYTDDDFTGITVAAASESKTFTINFSGFTIAGGSVSGLSYSTKWAETSSEWGSAYVVTPDVTVAADGASATFTVASTEEFYIDWTAVVVKDSSSNEITISSGNTESNKWYSYSGDVWSNTLTYVSGEYTALITDQAYSADGNKYVQILEASSFTDLSISTLKVVVKISSATEYWASASSASEYVESKYQSLSWSDDESGYAGVITSSDFISALATNGLYLNVATDAVGTVSVSYIAE